MVKLDDYQVESKDYLLSRQTALLFDEYGVGKTFPAIFAAWELMASVGKPTLVTAPAYLLAQWEKAIHECFPQAVVSVVNGNGFEARRNQLANPADFVLTSYHTWSTVEKRNGAILWGKYKDLSQRKWAVYIFDEAHRMRGRNSIWTKQVFKLRNADAKNQSVPIWLLTGTPMVRDGGDVWPYLYLVDRAQYRSYWTFVERWCDLEITPWDKKVGPVRNPAKFSEMLSRYALRRAQTDIPELAKLEQINLTIPVELPTSVTKSIALAKKQYRLEHPDLDTPIAFEAAGALYVAMRQLTTTPPTKANPKVEALMDYLEDHQARQIVYVWFRQSANTVLEAIQKKYPKRTVRVFTGDVSPKNKQEAIDAYWENEDCILIATVSALKEGANLQAGNEVVFLERSDLPGENAQAIARVKRRGQTHPVTVTDIYAVKSPDTVTSETAQVRALDIRQAIRSWLSED